MEDKTPFSMSQTINLVIGAVVVLIVLFIALTRIDKALKIKAIDDCMKSSRFEQTLGDGHSKASYPIQDQYKSCLKDKGY